MISVEAEPGGGWLVTVRAKTETQHHVTADAADVERLGGGKANAQDLIEASFRFLLEREPNTAILHSFDLSVISRYFPDYEREIAQRLTRSA